MSTSESTASSVLLFEADPTLALEGLRDELFRVQRQIWRCEFRQLHLRRELYGLRRMRAKLARRSVPTA